MTIPLVRPLPAGSSCLPGSAGARRPCGRTRARSLFGIAPGGACHAGAVASPPVGSYPTVSPLPIRGWAVCSLWRCPWGCPRRALPGTIASWSPDFPRRPRNPEGTVPPRSSSPPRDPGYGTARRGRQGGASRDTRCHRERARVSRTRPAGGGRGTERGGGSAPRRGRDSPGGISATQKQAGGRAAVGVGFGARGPGAVAKAEGR